VFNGSVVLVAINKNDTTATAISGLFTALPAGAYTDSLTGLLGGFSITVNNGGGTNPVVNFSLPAHTVAVWSFAASTSAPAISSIVPGAAQPGVHITIPGSGFGPSPTVKFGTTAATVVTNSANSLVVTVPSIANGSYNVAVTDSGGHVSNSMPFTVLAAKLIPVTFTVNNATPTNVGDYIFLTGSTVELGNWSTSWDGAVGPMLTPNFPNWFLNVSVPAGQNIQFKFIKIAAGGAVTWEAGANHSYTVPTSGTGFVTVNWQN